LPLGITVCRFGNIFYFGLAAFFVAQIYSVPVGLPEVAIIVLGAILAGTATAGASGLLTLPMLGFVLSPLGLPLEAVLVIFLAIDTIIDPMRTFLIVYVNTAATALVAPRRSGDAS
jgi:Na+/H+-dicarboxylate symporter